MPPASQCVGYIDESIHDGPGLYLVAVVFAHPEVCREPARKLAALVPGWTRPHWHAEDSPSRLRLVRAVAAFPMTAVAYECSFDSPGRKEAARARALRWLVSEMSVDVRHLVLDQRQEQQNKVDRKVLSGLAGRPPRFTVEHASSAKEPLLWLPDIVAGAVAARLLGRGGEYVEALGPVLAWVRAEGFRGWG
ncbi:hypothetical protein [Sphaerisporangium sp. NPDC051011]|uniref:hypothetical protein n=1 Tax=Sphaerisporangium sp. NPDC051011 TaxID=3155792 RepID=UPI0034077F29